MMKQAALSSPSRDAKGESSGQWLSYISRPRVVASAAVLGLYCQVDFGVFAKEGVNYCNLITVVSNRSNVVKINCRSWNRLAFDLLVTIPGQDLFGWEVKELSGSPGPVLGTERDYGV